MPESILYRKKMGFSVPLADWFRNELREDAEKTLMGRETAMSVFFDMNTVRKIWEDHQSGRKNYGAVLWSLYMFELWFQHAMRV